MSVLTDSHGDRLVCRASIQHTPAPKPPSSAGRGLFTAEWAQTRWFLGQHLLSRCCYGADPRSTTAEHSFPISDHLLLIADLSPEAAGSWRKALRSLALNQFISRASVNGFDPSPCAAAVHRGTGSWQWNHCTKQCWSAHQSTDTCG